MGNGIIERFNRIFIFMLGILDLEQKYNWRNYIYFLVYLYNYVVYDFIGFLFYYLMFGREFNFLVDLVFGINRNEQLNFMLVYIENLKQNL